MRSRANILICDVLRKENEMRIIEIMLASCLFTFGCQSTPDEEAKSQIARKCPNEHATITLVPITYGRIVMTPELREKEAKYESAFAGCDVNSMGKFKIVCTTCGAHTYEGKFPWYDKTTKVIPSGNAIK